MIDNVTFVTNALLKNLGVRISLEYLSERLKSNPFYPTLRSVSDFLNEHSVNHRVVRLTQEDLIATGGSFIAHSEESGGFLYYVTSINNGEIICHHTQRGAIRLPVEEFFRKWSGVALFATGEGKTHDQLLKNYREHRLNDSLLSWGFAFLSLLLIIRTTIETVSLFDEGVWKVPSWYYFYFTKLAGFAFSLLLVMHEMKIPSSIINRLCHVSRNADCNSVTRSALATLYGGITLADIGLTYFGGTLLAIILIPTSSLIPILIVLSVVILPLPLILILYQIIKIRKWCPLCMVVQAIVIAEAIGTFFIYEDIIFDYEGLIVLPASMGMVLLLIVNYRNHFQYKAKYLKERIGVLKLRRDPVVIDALLKRSGKIVIPANGYNMIFGDSGDVVQLTAFLSLHCGACARFYKLISTIMSSRNGLSAHLIFSTPPNGEEAALSKRVSKAYLSGNHTDAMHYLYDWFDKQVTFETNPEPEDANKYTTVSNEFADYNNKIFDTYNIKLVPVLFINGYKMPEGLSLDELGYYLEYLEETRYKLEIPIQRNRSP